MTDGEIERIAWMQEQRAYRESLEAEALLHDVSESEHDDPGPGDEEGREHKEAGDAEQAQVVDEWSEGELGGGWEDDEPEWDSELEAAMLELDV